jgi:hypothetical protein
VQNNPEQTRRAAKAHGAEKAAAAELKTFSVSEAVFWHGVTVSGSSMCIETGGKAKVPGMAILVA